MRIKTRKEHRWINTLRKGTGVGVFTAALMLVCVGAAWAQCGSDPGDDSMATAWTVACNTSGSYCIDFNGDADFYKFMPSYPAEVTFKTTGDTDTFMNLRSSSGAVLDQDDDGGSGHNASITWEVYGGSTYYVEVTGYGGTTTGAYDLEISGCCGSDPYNDDFDHATPWAGGYLSESIDCADDMDFYRFTAGAAGTYTFSATGDLAWQLEIYNESHYAIEQVISSPVSVTLNANEVIFLNMVAYYHDETFNYTGADRVRRKLRR